MNGGLGISGWWDAGMGVVSAMALLLAGSLHEQGALLILPAVAVVIKILLLFYLQQSN